MKGMQGCRRHVLAVALALACSGMGAETAPHRRWAIVTSAHGGDRALVDLLTARLSESGDMELLERAAIDVVMKELELSSLFAAKGAAGRLKLGRLLKADALLILGRENLGGKAVVRAVISDCRMGVRLYEEYVQRTRDGAATVDAIAEMAVATQRRFRSGIRLAVGVSHFLSKDLAHDYDYLQASCSHVLSYALASVPGVVVLEIEEARSLRQELETTHLEGVQRIIPLMVEGEYKVNPLVLPEPTVDMAVRFSDGRGLAKIIKKSGLTIADCTPFLSRTVPDAILKTSAMAYVQPLSVDAQFAALVARADAFDQLGDRLHAADLREAALLLKPADVAQRLAAMSNHATFIYKMARTEEDVRAQIARWRTYLRHYRFVAQHDDASPMDRIKRAAGVLYNARRVRSYLTNVNRDAVKDLAELEKARKAFLLNDYAKLIDFEKADPKVIHDGIADTWQRYLVEALRSRLDIRGYHKSDLDFFLHFLENVIPPDQRPSSQLFEVVRGGGPGGIVSATNDGYTRAEYEDYIGKLKASRHTRNRAFGRYMQLRYEWYIVRRRQKPKREMLDEAWAIEALFTKLFPQGYISPAKRTA
ncbi:hypothetical protein HQ560_03220, partial [bacterium]|nr:hypothetical protein [bacterium]